MRKYLAVISGDKYPLEFRVDASSFPTATARAIKQWQKRWPRSRTAELKIKIIRLN
jgi:hypothetical protein